MNKRKLQEFATWAKTNLESQIEVSLNAIGIHSELEIKPSEVKGEITIIEGIEKTFPKNFKENRNKIIGIIKELGYKNSIEQFAYTWFNRLVALRFMEVHGYLDHGFKVFPTSTNPIPEIMSKFKFAHDNLDFDLNYIEQLRSNNRNEDFYRYIIFKQCNSLSKPLPILFSKEDEFLEYLSPSPFLFGETIISKLIEIDESDFKEDVEIIGWLYQFYISNKKDEIRSKKGIITKETLPAITQLFTPDWIVRYMTENSLGRIWLESNPNSSLKNEMKYFVEEGNQEQGVLEDMKKVRFFKLEIEKLKIIEPACGSGHILIYAFELLFKMYKEKGYQQKDISKLILSNNLVGFDIDLRASQLASFALSMKARSIDNRFFDYSNEYKPAVFEIIDSKNILNNKNGRTYLEIISEINNEQWIENKLTSNEINEIQYVVELFVDAKVIGSLLKVKEGNYLKIREKLQANEKKTLVNLFLIDFFKKDLEEINHILLLAHYLSIRYDALITNPPYFSPSKLDKKPKEYLYFNYPFSKEDMFAMFMERDFVKQNGYVSIINMHSWMFLSSYIELRKILLNNCTFLSLIHLGSKAFEEIKGEIVQTVAFIFKKNKIPNYKTNIFRFTDTNSFDEKEKAFLKRLNKFFVNLDKVLGIPSLQFAYWIPDSLLEVFNKTNLIDKYIDSFQGIITGNNEKFVRYWYEIDMSKVAFDQSNMDLIDLNKTYWIPYNKGGEFRKWYGNQEFVVNWKNGPKDKTRGKEAFKKFYLKEYVSWSYIASETLATRFYPKGFLWDVNGSGIFDKSDMLFYLQAFISSKVGIFILNLFNPTLTYQVENILELPILVDSKLKTIIEKIVIENIDISKNDWDSSELSWNFKSHTFNYVGYLKDFFQEIVNKQGILVRKLIENEEYINNEFIKLYSLSGILLPNVQKNEITLRKYDFKYFVKALISWLIGVLMGRYSVKQSGLVFAGGVFDENKYGKYEVDKDGVIPMFNDLGIQVSLSNKIIKLIKQIHGESFYRLNIDFIAETLGKKNNETSEETLNRYLLEDFYSDHLKNYQKKPIYWMFSSGNKNGFKCLVYLHRYNENTLANINANYFLPATANFSHQLEELEQNRKNAGDSRRQLQIGREIDSLKEQLREAREYGLVLNHMANSFIKIELDDGVKVNYEKFQNIEIMTDNGKVKKDLLVPIK
jgi:type II restriction/modification system DNA methylase subunit YeeA